MPISHVNGLCTANEFIGGDLALLGEIAVAGWSLERLKKMPKQRLTELKLSGNLAGRDSGLFDREYGAGAFEV